MCGVIRSLASPRNEFTRMIEFERNFYFMDLTAKRLIVLYLLNQIFVVFLGENLPFQRINVYIVTVHPKIQYFLNEIAFGIRTVVIIKV